ncbi:MAG: YHYH protein [Sphingomonadales bacterium]|nr:YHYH protein [Sphingomonadales bacterium]
MPNAKKRQTAFIHNLKCGVSTIITDDKKMKPISHASTKKSYAPFCVSPVFIKKIFYLFFVIPFFTYAQLTPEVTSWIINTTGYTGYNNLPADVQQVQYSTANVYVSCSDIPAYSIGPWNGNPNTPTNQNFVFKITRTPQQNAGAPVATPLGHIGVWKNGVMIFNPKDAMSYNNQNIWHQNAVVVEAPSFDACLGHPAPRGEYHHHQNPVCLNTMPNPNFHSGILGFAFDGFPVYGCYAYQNTNGTGPIVRMKTSYRKRNITQRTSLPDGTSLSSSQYGPNVSVSYPLGYYLEDFEYVPGLGDLDTNNGRFCITPEYPLGIYAYFVTIDSTGTSEYPYVIGPAYYGTVQAGNIGPGSGHNTPSEPVITYTSVQEIIAEDKNISVYPNPFSSQTTLQTAEQFINATLTIDNCFGQTVMEIKNINGQAVTLQRNALSTGLYFIRLIEDNKIIATKKIIITD